MRLADASYKPDQDTWIIHIQAAKFGGSPSASKQRELVLHQ